MRVLDLGCGAGREAVELLNKDKRVQVWAVDYSVSMAVAAAWKLRETHPERSMAIAADAVMLPFRPQSADLVLAFNSLLNYVPAALLHQTLCSIRKSLRPNGHLLFACHSKYGRLDKNLYFALEPLLRPFVKRSAGPGQLRCGGGPGIASYVCRYFSRRELRKELEAAGFHVAELTDLKEFDRKHLGRPFQGRWNFLIGAATIA